MKNSNHHFLDTNILLSMALDNDRGFNFVEEYLKNNFSKYVSNTVCEESKRKINTIKRVSLSILLYVKEYSMNNQIDYLNLNRLNSFLKNNFLEKYENEEFWDVLTEDKFKNLVFDLFDEFSDEINQILITNDDKFLFKKINSTFKQNRFNLNCFLNDCNCISFIDSGFKEADIKNIGIHDSDAILLDEAYCLNLFLNQMVMFITMDRDILDLKEEIFNLLSKGVLVSHPKEFKTLNS